jgi:hypothetical protein
MHLQMINLAKDLGTDCHRELLGPAFKQVTHRKLCAKANLCTIISLLEKLLCGWTSIRSAGKEALRAVGARPDAAGLLHILDHRLPMTLLTYSVLLREGVPPTKPGGDPPYVHCVAHYFVQANLLQRKNYRTALGWKLNQVLYMFDYHPHELGRVFREAHRAMDEEFGEHGFNAYLRHAPWHEDDDVCIRIAKNLVAQRTGLDVDGQNVNEQYAPGIKYNKKKEVTEEDIARESNTYAEVITTAIEAMMAGNAPVETTNRLKKFKTTTYIMPALQHDGKVHTYTWSSPAWCLHFKGCEYGDEKHRPDALELANLAAGLSGCGCPKLNASESGADEGYEWYGSYFPRGRGGVRGWDVTTYPTMCGHIVCRACDASACKYCTPAIRKMLGASLDKIDAYMSEHDVNCSNLKDSKPTQSVLIPGSVSSEEGSGGSEDSESDDDGAGGGPAACIAHERARRVGLQARLRGAARRAREELVAAGGPRRSVPQPVDLSAGWAQYQDGENTLYVHSASQRQTQDGRFAKRARVWEFKTDDAYLTTAARAATFEENPAYQGTCRVPTAELASAGFIICPLEALGSDDPPDSAMCSRCGGVMGNWSADIPVVVAHLAVHPGCKAPRVRKRTYKVTGGE